MTTTSAPITGTTSSIDATITAGPDESYTGACAISSIYSSFQECAHRADSLRAICTSSYGSLTVWPGPCECSFYAQDLACFDEKTFCASQIWSQASQWFRDGVTTCLGNDKNYEVKAQIGTFENPFTITGLPGINATISSACPASTSALATPTGNGTARGALSPSFPLSSTKLSSGAIAGAVIGSFIGCLLVALAAYLFLRQAKKKRDMEAEAEREKNLVPELHDKDAIIHMKETKENCHEMPQAEPPELKGDEYAVEADSGEIHELESPKSPRSWFGM